MIIAAVVDWGALFEAIWHAAVSGILVSAIVGVSVRSYARWHDLRLEDGQGARATAHVTIAVVTAAAALACAVYCLYLITN